MIEAPMQIVPIERGAALPLSFAQQRLWFLDQLESQNAFYNIATVIRLEGALDMDALSETLNEVVRRHEVLRTYFKVVDGTPMQVIATQLPMTLSLTDLGSISSGEREARAQRLAQDEAQTPFDLSRGPLIRARLLRLQEREHIVLLTLHHIVSDGWSVGVLVQEVAALYAAYVRGEPSPLTELAIQYVDFAHWQRQWLQGGMLEAQLGYWKDQLSQAPTPLRLPTDRARPLVPRYEVSKLEFNISQSTTVGLRELGRRTQATLFMVLVASFNVLLSRYTGQTDICIGTPVANRMRTELEGLIGFFVNTLVLRTRLEGNPSFEAVLEQVRDTVLGAYAHQDVPFEQLVEILRPERHLSHAPLFQVVVVLQNALPGKLDLPGLSLQPTHRQTGQGVSKIDLTLSVEEIEEGLSASLEYNTDLFDRSTMERMTGHFTRLLEEVVKDASVRVAEVPILPPAERELLLVGWNDTAVAYSHTQAIHELFEAQVQRTPDAVAVVFEGERLSYAELNARANKLAQHLIKLGVGPEQRVGICVERSPEMVVGLLGILKAGGAYVPLDPSYPPERLNYMLADSAPAVVLTQSGVRDLLGAALGNQLVLELDGDADLWAGESQTNPEATDVDLTSSRLAYVIYTSGSTGRPKGVPLSVASLVNRLLWGAETILKEAPTTAFKTGIGFVDSVTEILGTLVRGGKLVVFDDPTTRDPYRFCRILVASGVSNLIVVPSLLRLLLDNDTAVFANIRTLVCSGEKLTEDLIHEVKKRYPRIRLFNFYGSSEINGDSIVFECASEDASPSGRSVIGRPIWNTRIYILDAQGEPVPVGVHGELYIGGAGVARGYLNLPQLTAERFVPSPFVGDDLLYRTGDLARYLADGNIEYLGRNDDQVKIRGFRIELGEIEAALVALPQVREAVVLAREDEPGEKRLVAYLVPERERSAEVALDRLALRMSLLQSLPEFMLPSAYVALQSLPLTPNGKLDRSALPAPGEGAYVRRGYEAPQGPIETSITDIWRELLGVEQVGRHDNFFELSGHSLLAVRLLERMRRAGLVADMRVLFEQPTLAALAAAVDGARGSARSAFVPIRTKGAQRPLFLVHEWSGTDAYFPLLGPHIDPDIPVYGLPGVPLDELQLQTFEGLAERLLGVIRSVQHNGPYRIAGWSFGGLLAYEIAAQLIGLDEEVEFIGLFDTPAPALSGSAKTQRVDAQISHNSHLLENFRTFWEQHDADGNAFAMLKKLSELEKVASEVDFVELVRQCRERGVFPPGMVTTTTDELWKFLNRTLAHDHARANYTVFPISAKIHLFIAEERPGDTTASSDRAWLGWNTMLPQAQLRRVIVPGNHHSMMEASHIAALGQAVSEALRDVADNPPRPLPERDYRPMLTINAIRHGKAPIICIPGAGASVTGFVGLTEVLGGGWPVIGMQPRGMEGQLTPHSSVEAAAAAYLKALDATLPEGQVHLIGHSFGGWVALEMASRLHTHGRVVSLTLVDSEAPGVYGPHGHAYTTTEVLLKFLDLMGLAVGKTLGVDATAIETTDAIEQTHLIHSAMVRSGLMPTHSSPDDLGGTLRVFGSALRTQFEPREQYPGLVRLVLTDDTRVKADDNRKIHQRMRDGWEYWAPDLHVWHGPGNHLTVLKQPHIQRLARWWCDGLTKMSNERDPESL